MEKCTQILKSYANYFQMNFEDYFELPEAELIGSITGFISAYEPDWNIKTQQPLVVGDSRFYPDILIEVEGERLIIEVKRNRNRDYSMFYDVSSPVLEQLNSYMRKSSIERGIAFYTPAHKDDEIITAYQVGTEQKLKEIYSVRPDMIPSQDELDQYDSEISA
jgi:hypothetical protein